MLAAKNKIASLLAHADIKINGSRPWDMQVHNENLYRRILSQGSIGAGEAYMDGWWDSEALDKFFTRVIGAKLPEKIAWNLPTIWLMFKSSVFNMQTVSRAKKVAKEHYNLGNDLYMSFLDPYNQYTCGYFEDTEDLNQAQENKLELICRKLYLKPSDRVLDIGCGWGGFSRYAAENYGCQVTGISISDEQIKYAREFCSGLPVEIIKQDYRHIEGEYDKVLICGMIEHVGYRNYPTIMAKVKQILAKDGLFLLHTIGSPVANKATDPWISKYIFANSMTPSASQLNKAAEGLFIMEDWHNFGPHYVKTLKAWYKNFLDNWHLIADRYDQRFKRMWTYYLLGSAGFFASRAGQLWQIVFSPEGVAGGYASVRSVAKKSESSPVFLSAH